MNRHRQQVISERQLGLGILSPPRIRVVKGGGYWLVYDRDRRWVSEEADWCAAIELATSPRSAWAPASA